MNYVGQLIGILAIGISALIYAQTSRFKMVFLKLVTDVLWIIHHISIHSYTASATTAIAIVRECVFLPRRRHGFNAVTVCVFSSLFIAASLITWKDIFSIFPAIASVLSTFAFGNKRVRLIQIFAFLSSVCMLIYGIHYLSIPTVINEILVEGSISVSLIKEFKMKGCLYAKLKTDKRKSS